MLGEKREREKGDVSIELEHVCWQYAGESVEAANPVISVDRRQMTRDFFFFVSVCMVSGVPSLCITHTFAPLQPTAHLASMEYPLNISLYSLSTHRSLRFFFLFPLACVSRYESVSSPPTAVAVTCVFWDVIQLLSFPKSSPKPSC